MAAKDNLIKAADIAVTAREVDFVERFGKNWEHLQAILGIMKPIKMIPGTKLNSKYAQGSLQSGKVGEGEEIPYSKFTVKEKEYGEITIEKFAKGVSIEAIKKWGYEVAVAKTDNEFLSKLQSDVTDRFYTYLKTGTLKSTESNFQLALAMAKGNVVNKFKTMNRDITEVVAFVNVLDVYRYLGTANISVQTAFGMEYLENFMGFKTVFLLGDNEIPQGKVIATPVENINLYYVDPSDSEYARAGLSFTTSSGDTQLIGVHVEGNYRTLVSEMTAILGITLFAEYIDGIAVVTVSAPTTETTPTETPSGSGN